jgi:hypothetical protein
MIIYDTPGKYPQGVRVPPFETRWSRAAFLNLFTQEEPLK